ncbi:hypothetical protein ACSU64_24815, partial [Bacillaceae bacterium C204]|uniref:hypothetical protein n=1 Tax=Neobacillus sp. 204 TaxID=3383351 RepID=UPI00397DD9B5
MSEVALTSDKVESKKQGHVRSRTNFGQGSAKKSKVMSEVELTSDKEVPKSKVMSEVELTSDKEVPKSKVMSEVVLTSD